MRGTIRHSIIFLTHHPPTKPHTPLQTPPTPNPPPKKNSDPRRRAVSAALDPSGRLCAVTDALGRVLVVDVWARQVVRLFKGHRRAQVCF